jgi:uncharacterized protein YqeY
MLEQKLEQDIKKSLLSGDRLRLSTLRLLKAGVLNFKVANNSRYLKSGNKDKADAEMAEKSIIDEYLPNQLSEEEISSIVVDAIKAIDASGLKDMGKVIQYVKDKTKGAADSAIIAKITKEKLT